MTTKGARFGDRNHGGGPEEALFALLPGPLSSEYGTYKTVSRANMAHIRQPVE